MKRGRKLDNTLPPSRSREIQRAFRQRRCDYIRGLELRVVQLEAEVDEVLARHNETLRYTTAEVVAARSASRKRQKNKSKHNLSQFIDVNQLGEPSTPHSLAFLSMAPDNSTGIAPSPPMTSNHDMRTDASCGVRYLIRDMSSDFSSGQSSPQYSKASFPLQHPDDQHEYESRGANSASILSRRSKPLLQLWNAPTKSNDSRLSSYSSNLTNSSQVSMPISCNQYHNTNSSMEMFVDMDPVVPSPDMSSQLMSSMVFRPEMRIVPPSCSLPSLLADSSPPNDSLPNDPFTPYHSNPPVDSPSYTYRTTNSQFSHRLNSCSYNFIDSPNNASPNVPGYPQESHLSLLRSRSSMSDQTNLHTGSLSTLIAIAATRLDRFEHQESEGGYQTSALQASTALIESSTPSESLGNPEALQASNHNFFQDEYAKSTRTATPCSTSPSESKELRPQSQYDSHSLSNENISFDELIGNQNSTSLSFYHPSTAKNWQDENMSPFAAEMYQSTNTSEVSR